MSPTRKSFRVSAKQPRKHRPTPAGRSDRGSRRGGLPQPPSMQETPGADLDPVTVRAALAAVGLLGAQPGDADLPIDPAEIAALERADDAWLLATFTQPLGLGDAVIEDRA
jgi:hypothetical protein